MRVLSHDTGPLDVKYKHHRAVTINCPCGEYLLVFCGLPAPACNKGRTPVFGERKNMRVGPLGIPEIAIIVVVILLIFGARRLPEIGTSMGKGIRTFKTALMGEDEKGDPEKAATSSKDDMSS